MQSKMLCRVLFLLSMAFFATSCNNTQSKMEAKENISLTTYPSVQYTFGTPKGWTLSNESGLMKAKTIRRSLNGVTLSIKFLSVPNNGYKKSSDINETMGRLKAGYEQMTKTVAINLIKSEQKNFGESPAIQIEYLLNTGAGKSFHRILDFDNGKGIYRLHGTINPADNSYAVKNEFDLAWGQVVASLKPL